MWIRKTFPKLFCVASPGVHSGGLYLLDRKSLAPVVAMSSDVDRIGSGNLAARIEVANPGDELGNLAGTFNRLLQRLQLSFDRQRQFMADASHELRTQFRWPAPPRRSISRDRNVPPVNTASAGHH